MSKEVDGWTDVALKVENKNRVTKRTNKRTDEQTDRQTDKQTNKKINWQMGESTDAAKQAKQTIRNSP